MKSIINWAWFDSGWTGDMDFHLINFHGNKNQMFVTKYELDNKLFYRVSCFDVNLNWMHQIWDYQNDMSSHKPHALIIWAKHYKIEMTMRKKVSVMVHHNILSDG